MPTDWRVISGVIAGIIALVAFIPYNKSILRGKSYPSKATWIVLTIVGLLNLISYHSTGESGNSIWIPVVYFFAPASVLIILLTRQEKTVWSPLELVCLVGACIGIILWAIFHSSIVGLYIFLFIDLLGVIPTMKNALFGKEQSVFWISQTVASILNLITIQKLSLSSAYLIYMLLGNGIIAVLALWSHFKVRPRRSI